MHVLLRKVGEPVRIAVIRKRWQGRPRHGETEQGLARSITGCERTLLGDARPQTRRGAPKDDGVEDVAVIGNAITVVIGRITEANHIAARWWVQPLRLARDCIPNGARVGRVDHAAIVEVTADPAQGGVDPPDVSQLDRREGYEDIPRRAGYVVVNSLLILMKNAPVLLFLPKK